MALIKCTECGKEISDRADRCINCGCPMAFIISDHEKSHNTSSKENKGGKLHKIWTPSVQDCKRIITSPLAQQWEDNDKQKLHSLFAEYRDNTSPTDVMKKVKVLDKIFSTNIHRFSPKNGLQIISDHICSIFKIDIRLSEGDITVVDDIADTKEKIGRYTFSFATKYSYFSNPPAYPICDENVCLILRDLNKQEGFIGNRLPRAASDLIYKGGAAAWKEIIDTFRSHFGLGQFSYREIDLYLSIKYRELN